MFRCQLFPTLSPNRFIFLFFFRPAVVFSSFQQNSSSSNLISFLSCNWIFMAFLVFSQSYLSFSFLYTRHGFYLSSFHSEFSLFTLWSFSLQLIFCLNFFFHPPTFIVLSLFFLHLSHFLFFFPFLQFFSFFLYISLFFSILSLPLSFSLSLHFSSLLSPTYFFLHPHFLVVFILLPLSLFLWEFPPTLPLSLGISSHSPSFFGNFLPLSLFLWEFPPTLPLSLGISSLYLFLQSFFFSPLSLTLKDFLFYHSLSLCFFLFYLLTRPLPQPINLQHFRQFITFLSPPSFLLPPFVKATNQLPSFLPNEFPLPSESDLKASCPPEPLILA
ncbi:unnamed protein product [Acanthosepion pharaonis]|uniref:Uncharacterized protein n=1 Tax=Acanthosepion pharaonis TaxID=158019 RepID=A0A812B7L4_ACAPH|nr:unnamed protein product [Sepia pharaonis]